MRKSGLKETKRKGMSNGKFMKGGVQKPKLHKIFNFPPKHSQIKCSPSFSSTRAMLATDSALKLVLVALLAEKLLVDGFILL